MSFGDRSVKIGALWKELDAEGKAEYEAKAARESRLLKQPAPHRPSIPCPAPLLTGYIAKCAPGTMARL